MSVLHFILFIFIYLFVCLFIYLFLAVLGLHCSAWASHCGGFSCCRARALGAQASVVVVHGLSSCGSWALEHRLSSCGTRAVVPWHVGSSWTRDRICVPCIGRQILNHGATREVPEILNLKKYIMLDQLLPLFFRRTQILSQISLK